MVINMRRIISMISLVFFIMTEAAYAASVNIGVIDTGIRVREDIFDNTKIAEGKNYVQSENNTNDSVGHGTRVASLIIGTADGEIVSPCSESVLVPLVYYTKLASGAVLNGGIDAICDAVYDAVDVYGCKVINISSGITADDERLKKAVENAEEKGALIVSSCGNDGGNVYYPAAYEIVIGVGSCNEKNEPSDFSCRGEGIDMLTAGEELKVVSIKNSDKYESISGTSYSTALITAQAAAAFERCPKLQPNELRYIMRISCDDICDVGYDEDSGYGVFNEGLFYENLALWEKGELLCFFDVKKDDWYYESVKEMYELGIMNGTGECFFSPEENVTRAMFVTMLYRAEGATVDSVCQLFEDVDKDDYYADAVSWACETGIVLGYSETEFAPDRSISRQEAAVILKRCYDMKNIGGASYELPEFSDKNEIADWAAESVSWAVGTGLMGGNDDGCLNPAESASRAETAVMLHRFFEI